MSIRDAVKRWYDDGRRSDVFYEEREADDSTAQIIDHRATILLCPRDLDKARIVVIDAGESGIVYVECWRRLRARGGRETIDPEYNVWSDSDIYAGAALDTERHGLTEQPIVEICDAAARGEVAIEATFLGRRLVRTDGSISLKSGPLKLSGQGALDGLLKRTFAALKLSSRRTFHYEPWKEAR